MKVLSLFDGISCLRVALGNRVVEYYASEIDNNAIKISTKNYPNIKRLGSVCDISGFTGVDLLVGGSPCTDLSIAKKGREGLKGDRSKLFYEYVRIWKEAKPTWFILENVASMSEKDKETITSILGVEPIMINAALVSAQSRKRLFWTNIPVRGSPADRGILLKDIIETGKIDDRYYMKNINMKIKNYNSATDPLQIGRVIGRRTDKDGKRKDGDTSIEYEQRVEVREDQKTNVISTATKDNVIIEGKSIRRLTPKECERLQSLPDDYTAGVSMTARYRALGNAFNVEVIKFILSFIP